MYLTVVIDKLDSELNSLISISLIVNWLVMEYKLDSELLLIDKLDN